MKSPLLSMLLDITDNYTRFGHTFIYSNPFGRFEVLGNMVKDAGGGFVSVVRTLGIVAGLMGIIFTALSCILMLNDFGKRGYNQVKREAMTKFTAIVFFFSIVDWIALIATMGLDV